MKSVNVDSQKRPRRRPYAERLRRALERIGPENAALLLALALLVFAIWTQTDKFFLPRNLLNVGQSIAVLGLVSAGQTMVIVSRGLDISVGSTAGCASVAAAFTVTTFDAPLTGILVGVVVGLLLGFVNAGIITWLRVNPVVATLATLSAFQGLAFLIAPGGRPIGVLNRTFAALGSGRVAATGSFPGIPIPLLILVALAFAMHVLMRTSVFGRYVYAMGGNPEAARLAGISLPRMKVAVYGISGALAGLAGAIVTARTTVGHPVSGTEGLELESITAVFLGGAILAGGRGTIGGTMLAVVLLGTLSNGMNLLGIPTFYQLVARGMLLVLAVAIGQWRVARTERAQALAAAG